MRNKRTIIIGDVHGCLVELEKLIHKLKLSNEDRIIFVGDLINKGPDSLGVLEKALSLSAEVVVGNNELGFLNFLEEGLYPLESFKKLKKQMGSKLNFWKDWLKQLPLFIEDSEFIVVHAGLNPKQHPSDTSRKILTTIRTWGGDSHDLNNPKDPPWYELYHHSKLIIFGHWAQKGLVIRENALGIDTGCVYGRKLTAVTLPDRTLHQVSANQIYEPIIIQ